MTDTAHAPATPAKRGSTAPSRATHRAPADVLGPSTPLPSAFRFGAEAAYGASLGHVELHTGAEATAFARANRARAVTVGQHVAVADGWYRPGTLAGDALLAHEVAHVVQQGGTWDPTQPLPPAGPSGGEADADRAAAGLLMRSRRTDLALAAQPRRGFGLRMQRCSDEPQYVTVQPGAAPTRPSDVHAGSRAEEFYGDTGLFSYIDGAHQAVIDGDGDQSAELELRMKGTHPDDTVFQYPTRLEVAARRLGNTPDLSGPGTEQHTVTFDVSGVSAERRVSPRLEQRTDGHSPTRLVASGGTFVPFAKMDIAPPSPYGDQATYAMAVTRRPTYADQTVTETQSVTFNRDPDDIFPVFVAGAARQAGTIWAVDANVGRYGDPFRFTFRKPDQQGSVVSMGITPMSDGVAIGASHIELPISGPLNVRVVRARGPMIEFDLNGDGRTDVSLYERVDPERPRTGYGRKDASRWRTLTFTAVDANGKEHHVGRHEVQDGMFVDTVEIGRDFATISAASTFEGMAQAAAVKDIDADQAGIMRRLTQLREKAVGEERLSGNASNLFAEMVNLTLAAIQAPQAQRGDAYVRASQAARHFDSVWTTETAAGIVELTRVPSTIEPDHAGKAYVVIGHENPYTGGRGSGPQAPLTNTVASRLSLALAAGSHSQALTLLTDLSAKMLSWIASRYASSTNDADRKVADEARSLGALLPKLDRLIGKEGLTKVTAVFHSAPEYIARRVPPNLPLRMYFWKEDGKWCLQDLTHPENEKSLGILREDIGEGESAPSHDLFERFDDRDRFPKGFIQYQIPNGGRAGTVQTTAPWEWHDVFGWVSMGLAAAALVAGLVLSGGTAAPVIVPALWSLSAVAGAAGAVAHMIHEQRQGRLTGGAIALDVAQIVGSLAGATVLGARSVAAFRLGARGLAAATAVEAAGLGAGSLKILLVTQVATDTAQVLLMGGELVSELARIEAASGMSDADRLRARIMAIGRFGFAAGLTYVSVRANVQDLNRALARGSARLVDAHGETIAPGMHTREDYARELDRYLGTPATSGSRPDAPGAASADRVRIVPVEEAGSSIGLARIDIVNGKPQLVVVDGAPLHVIAEEAAHFQQFALTKRTLGELTDAERRVRSAVETMIDASRNWQTMSPAQRVKAHRARLLLEEDAQQRLLARFEADLDAGRPVNSLDVDNAWQNLENIRRRQADLVGTERQVASGGQIADVDPDINQAPALFTKKTQANTSVDAAWQNLNQTDFVRAYRSRYPDTTLTWAELRQRHRMGQRLNPVTGRLIDPTSTDIPDVTARYRAGDPESMAMQGSNRTNLSRSEQARIDALLHERDLARKRRDRANISDDARHAAQWEMNEASRQLGEESAAIWVRQRYPGTGQHAPTMVYGGNVSRTGDFDQVWKCSVLENGKRKVVWVVVEAKGGSSPLGNRKTNTGTRAQQGTSEYYEDILQEMFKRGGESRDAVEGLRAAAKNGEQVRYVHVETPISYTATTGGGEKSSLSDVSIRDFDLSPVPAQ